MAKKTAVEPAPSKEEARTAPDWRKLLGYLRLPRAGTAYVLLALFILGATTVFWGYQSAVLNNGNADQLINTYLLENSKTFHSAQIPSQHSFLLKWPVFYMVHLWGASPPAFIWMTVLLCAMTIGIFAYMLYRIDKRPWVFGTLLLALASVLLLIPAQPYPGGLLPVNMAMLATRNIEYIFLLAGIYLLVTSARVKSKRFGLGIALLALLIASDKLFMTLAVGGALLALLSYVLVRHWQWASRSARWCLGAIAASLIGIGLLSLVQVLGVTHMAGQGTTGPYGLVNSFHAFGTGLFYALTGLFTNLGANPATGTTVASQMPRQAWHNLFGIGLLPFLVNVVVLGGGLWAMVQITRKSLFTRAKNGREAKAHIFSLSLIWVSISMLLVFVLTNHYYAADARYLSLITFTLFISLAVVLRQYVIPQKRLLLSAVVLILSVIAGLAVANNRHHQEAMALAVVNQRNTAVAQVLKQHPTEDLVGDYWRITPTKLSANKQLNVTPLGDCATPRNSLNSQQWQPDLNHRSFAYLLSLDQKLTDYPSCSLNQTITNYGRPNSSTLIAGSIEQPKELLLFYDHGAHASAPAISTPTPATVTPIPLDELPHTTCSNPTIMNIVAHQDDDLLFMNPDLIHEVKAGYCIRTIYTTAGDAGGGNFYWLGRQRGSEAAYSNMLNFHDIWVERIVKLDDHQFVTIANPKGNTNVSLIFMHLPDGSPNGQGFSASRHESLALLEAGHIRTLDTVDGQSSYTSNDLVVALTRLMHTFQPTQIHTQANFMSKVYPDHSDHMATGRYAQRAYQQYEAEQYHNEVSIPLTFYIGYPIHALPENVTGQDLADKKAAFYAYAQFDAGVCHDDGDCAHVGTYYAYLRRQYTDTMH